MYIKQIEIDNFKSFATKIEIPLLKGFSTIVGPNGSGKTTTINCILSLLSYDKGDIEIFGEKMTPDNYKIKSQIGVVMQNVAVFEELTVYENINYFYNSLISFCVG